MQRRTFLTAAAAATLATPPLVSARAQDYPTRPVRIIVGFAPGGGSDLVARPLAQKLQPLLGQPFVVENRGGANGNLGLDAVAKSAPDGYTFGHVNNSVIAMNPLLYRNLPFNAKRDLVPLVTVTQSALFMMIPASLPVRTLPEFIEYARRRPGELNFGSGGAGGITHLGFELFRNQMNLDISHVPYRGSAPALQDMLGGRIQLMMDAISLAKPQVDAGLVRAIAFLGRERHPALNTVPTAVEQGYPDLVVPSWQGFVAPAGTPAPVLARLEDAFRRAVADPDIQSVFATQGQNAVFRGQQDMARMIQEEEARWAPIIRDLNIQLD
ncbi:Bug family tripartite tricarboxylate transporter substrate binding protein [Roseococcus pinisoli]|uniref:Tripartite tricarboxylate transporter substrate binding protein n=1 Tax=Roseococcus pinisoli TaxID=2835040 RepID=A0ABS5QHS6_9PROT|nr:tripartite tricarboxylate transporter substrate binding protein [Roseococcus pinisoli]MBS7813250.1 tripartite tricarboxylate transporter substrate binding protein [Roseococcus pinisoli]